MPAQNDAETRRKADAFDARMAADARSAGRSSMLTTIEQTHGKAARAAVEARLAPERPAAQADDLAALPKSLAEAKGDARAFAKADIRRQAAAQAGGGAPSAGASASRASMLAEMKRQGLESVR